MKRQSVIFVLFSFLILGSACSESEVGSKQRPLAMYFVPSEDTSKIARNADEIARFLSRSLSQKIYQKDEGFYVKAAIPASFIAVVEAFGTKKADFAALNTFSYILLKEKKRYPVEAILNVVRGHNETSYKAQIIARVDSGINSLEDLKGKKFAYSDPASTSGYILPSLLFKEQGIELGQTIFAQRHDNVVTMVYQKQVDAGATYYSPPEVEVKNGKKVETIRDARARVLTQFPDVTQKVKIIGFSQSIPNAPWVVRENLFKDEQKNRNVKNWIQEAMLSYSLTDEGKKVLDDLYSISGLVKTDDSEFENIRNMFRKSDVDIEDLVKKN